MKNKQKRGYEKVTKKMIEKDKKKKLKMWIKIKCNNKRDIN